MEELLLRSFHRLLALEVSKGLYGCQNGTWNKQVQGGERGLAMYVWAEPPWRLDLGHPVLDHLATQNGFVFLLFSLSFPKKTPMQAFKGHGTSGLVLWSLREI